MCVYFRGFLRWLSGPSPRPHWTIHGILLLILRCAIVLFCLNELLYALSFEEVRAWLYQRPIGAAAAAVNSALLKIARHCVRRRARLLVIVAICLGAILGLYILSKRRSGALWRGYGTCVRATVRFVRWALCGQRRE